MLKDKEFWSSIKHFKKDEFECNCGCGLNNINHDSVYKLQTARFIARTTFFINRACSCKPHNDFVGGSDDSSHLDGFAFDIDCDNSLKRFKIVNALLKAGFTRIGVYKTFIHVDDDSSKSQNVIWYA